MTITVIVDVSGSMASMAKIHVAASLLGFCKYLPLVNKDKYTGLNFKFCKLGSLEELKLEDFGSVLKTCGRAELSSLEDLLKKTDKKALNFLFLTDGRFQREDTLKFQDVVKSYPDIRFVPIAIGADADEYTLNGISTRGTIFHPEDAVQAVETFFSGQSDCPVSAASIKSAIENDGEDDWDA